MDALFEDFPGSAYGFRFDHHGLIPGHQNHNLVNSNFNHTRPNQNPFPISPDPSEDSPSSPTLSSSDGHPLDYNPYASEALKFISDMLMEEEDLGDKPCMLQDSLALQAAEKSFYEALVQKGSVSAQPVQVSGESGEPIGSPGIETSPVANLCTPIGGKQNHRRDDGNRSEEGRRKKIPVVSTEDSEQSEFDKVLLCPSLHEDSLACSLHGSYIYMKEKQPKGSKRKQKNNTEDLVDLWTLLAQCAQAVSVIDNRTATKLLTRIRQHSSPSGDGTQRLAHYFVNALETRLAGIGAPAYAPIGYTRTSAADILKAYQVCVLASPYKKMSNFYANRSIMKLAAKKTKLHIIDFGIAYGFQWPCLIQRLSARSGGPPKLRITGIDLPQSGFRPEERVQETGNRLRRYCQRFNVPFEYNVVAKKWETIQLEDLKIDEDEVIVVNSLHRFQNLPDDTISSTSARDTVLNLIKKINPDLFIHGVVSGTYNAPFFVTRFREALFHFAAGFDMFDATVAREDPWRVVFEREIFGKDIMNVIACEGVERVERPETYKQWQSRCQRAGLLQVPLDKELLRKVEGFVTSSYHPDFVIDVDGHWMLQGWKGRVIYALSCWMPVKTHKISY